MHLHTDNWILRGITLLDENDTTIATLGITKTNTLTTIVYLKHNEKIVGVRGKLYSKTDNRIVEFQLIIGCF